MSIEINIIEVHRGLLCTEPADVSPFLRISSSSPIMPGAAHYRVLEVMGEIV